MISYLSLDKVFAVVKAPGLLYSGVIYLAFGLTGQEVDGFIVVTFLPSKCATFTSRPVRLRNAATRTSS